MDMYTVQDYVDRLNQVAVKRNEGRSPGLLNIFRIDEGGRKYHKVVHGYKDDLDESPSHVSVHAFVDKDTGDIYKPASWRGPAKGVRHNLKNLDNIALDIFGSYLYMG